MFHSICHPRSCLDISISTSLKLSSLTVSILLPSFSHPHGCLSAFYLTGKFGHVHKSPPVDRLVLAESSPSHTLLLKSNFITIILSVPTSPKASLQVIQPICCMHFSSLPCVMCDLTISSSDHRNYYPYYKLYVVSQMCCGHDWVLLGCDTM
jgi:hypothetical protein